MNNSAKKSESPARSRKRSALARTAVAAASFLSSPMHTVNSLIEWLNETLGLELPTLPLAGAPAIVQVLWEMYIVGDFPSGPMPWSVSIDGSWPAIFPQVGSPPVTLENLTVHIEQKPVRSPDLSQTETPQPERSIN